MKATTTAFAFIESAKDRAYEIASHQNVPVWIIFRPARASETILPPGESWLYDVLVSDRAPDQSNLDDGADIKGHYTPDGEWHPWIMARDDVARELGITPGEVREALADGTLGVERIGRIDYVRGADVEHVKAHGGYRAGAGRKPLGTEPMERRTVTLPAEMIAQLDAWGDGNLSAGIRALAANLVAPAAAADTSAGSTAGVPHGR